MKNTSSIAADLDLNASLRQFQTTIEALLEWEDIAQWDGTPFKEREAQIRHSGLVLAGQCVALLLTRLNQSVEARQIAAQRTNGQRQVGSQGHGHRTLEVVTMGNVTGGLTLPYVGW